MAGKNGAHEEKTQPDSAVDLGKEHAGSPSNPSSSSDDYVLTRDVGASARLNLSHYIWLDAFGFNLHPRIADSIARSEHLRVADVGTGTG